MTKKKIVNPLSRFGFWLVIAVGAFFGIAALTGQSGAMSSLVLPVAFFCAFYFTLWIVFQYRTGEITLVSQAGMKSTYTRKKNKIWFFFIIVVGFCMGAFLTITLGSDLFLGCEWSLINSCPPG